MDDRFRRAGAGTNGEQRWVALGISSGVAVSMTCTERKDRNRPIDCRLTASGVKRVLKAANQLYGVLEKVFAQRDQMALDGTLT